MAEKQNTYKYIDTDIDSDLLLANLKHNAQNYVKHKKWDESKAKEFYSALNNFETAISDGRLSSDQSGDIIDAKGLIDNGMADWRDQNGKVLSEEEYQALNDKEKKKATKDFLSNREVASYLGIIAKDLYNKERAKKPKEAPKFDLKTHGLWDKFINHMAPGGTGDLEAWWDTDPYDEKTKKRSTTKRAKLFSDYIDEYIANLSEDIDFKDSDFKSRENYLARLEALKEELKNGINSNDYRFINQLGGTPEQYRTFFTTDKTYIPKDKQTEAEAAAAAAGEDGETPATSEEDAKVKARLNNLEGKYKKAFFSAKYPIYNAHSRPTGVKYDTSAANKVVAYQNALNAANINFSVERLQNTRGTEYINYLEQYGQMNPAAIRTVEAGQYAGWNYIPESLNKKNFSVLAYNPNTHQVARLYYGMLGMQARQDYANILRQMDSWNDVENKPLFQEGGVINIPQEEFNNDGPAPGATPPPAMGAAAAFDLAQKELSVKTKSDPKNRQPWKKENNYSNTGPLTTTDYARLGAIAADIAALVDPEPISAGVLGIGSDVTNFVADIKEGQGWGNALGSFAGNLGLSAIGLVPVLGDAAGSGSKVVKGLIKLAPKVNKILLGSGILIGLSNADEIIKSFSKIGKDGPENEMNMQDWRNIGLGVQLILGGANAYRNVKAGKRMRAAKEASVTSHMDVKVKDASGAEKVLRFGGAKDVAALRNAKTPEQVNAVINSHPSMKDKYSVITESKSGHTWFGDESSWYKPWSWRQKTSTEVLNGPVVNPVYSAQRFNSLYTPSGRGRYIGTNVQRTNPDEFIKYDFNPNSLSRIDKGKLRLQALRNKNKPAGGTTPANTSNTPPNIPPPSTTPKQQPGFNKGNGYSGPGKKPQKAPQYENMRAKTLIDRAKDYKANLQGSAKGQPHSPEYNELVSRGNSESYLRSLGVWKQGGKLIPKAQEGFQFALPEKPKINLDFSVLHPFGLGHILNNETNNNGVSNETSNEYTNVPNYGTGYMSSRNYLNQEYGTSKKVNLLGIKIANAAKRDKALHPDHLAAGYNYNDAQFNTNQARDKWQSNPDNRTADFMNWVTNWRTQHPTGTQLDMLSDYNHLIDKMYDYKRQMSTAPYVGRGSYRKGNTVKLFNQTNKAIYGSANSPGGVHGYSVPLENVNGTTTAQRFIDITDDNISDLNFKFKDDATDDFKNLFSGLVKDRYGRYFVYDKTLNFQPPSNKESDSNNKNTTDENTNTFSTINPAVESSDSENSNSKKFIDIDSLLANALPNAIAASRYLLARNNNNRLFEQAKQAPVLLYDPMEAHKWLYGNEQAIMAGRQAAGRLNSLASRAITSDGAQQQAAQMEGYMKGLEYIQQGQQQDAEKRERTAAAEWEQERLNQKSRYDTAMFNRQNIFQKKQSVLTALGARDRANYESLNGFLAELENKAKLNNEQLLEVRENAQKASLQNDISANLENYGIPATLEDQQLINDLLTEKRKLSDLSEEEKATYQRLSNSIQEEVTKRIYAIKGIQYKPFVPNNTSLFIPEDYKPVIASNPVVTSKAKGGSLGDSEKVTIQKLKSRMKEMELFQKQMNNRLTAYQKDIERAQRSADNYIKGQKRK